ncbi:MAG: aminodeoxychorismate/anthranilate synthase component II, partial [bacterium]
NLVQYLGELGAEIQVYRNDKIDVQGVVSLNPEALVISPGPKRPEHAGISMDLISLLAGKIPILGVCLGCQCIGQLFKGKVVNAPRLMHGKSSDIIHEGEGILSGIPSPFTAGRYHSLIIDSKTLPGDLKVMAKTDQGEIMGVMHKKLAHCYGLQFHPESILTPMGKNILKNFLNCKV